MKFFKKTTSVVLSVLMVSNFTFCRALEQPTDSEENKESSSIFSYIIAGASSVASAIGLFALYHFVFGRDSEQNSEPNKNPEPSDSHNLNDSKNNSIPADANSGNDNDNNYYYDENKDNDKRKKDIQKNPESFSFDFSENNVPKKEENHGLGKPLRIPGVPANIKAIYWNKHRCWWMASVLFLYYWSEFKSFIYDNAGNKFASVQNKNCRDVLMDLNDIFKILDKCDGNVCYITEDESRMGKYFNNLKGLGNVVVVDNTPNFPLILNLLSLFYDEPDLKRFNLETAEGAEYYDTFTGKVYDVKFMLSQIRDGHFYVYLEPIGGGEGFAIGISTTVEDTINICDLAWNNHAHWPFIKVFKGFKESEE